ncbi:hypothetical protein [Actinophytocola sp. KF-1]
MPPTATNITNAAAAATTIRTILISTSILLIPNIGKQMGMARWSAYDPAQSHG